MMDSTTPGSPSLSEDLEAELELALASPSTSEKGMDIDIITPSPSQEQDPTSALDPVLPPKLCQPPPATVQPSKRAKRAHRPNERNPVAPKKYSAVSPEPGTVSNTVTPAACQHPVMLGNLCAHCGQVIDDAPGTDMRVQSIDANDEMAFLVSSRTSISEAKQAKRAARAAQYATGRATTSSAEVATVPPVAARGGGVSSHMDLPYLGGGLRISKDNADKASARARAALIQSQRLILVLDLDHTLLNSKAVTRLAPQDRQPLQKAMETHGSSSNPTQQTLFHLPNRHLWTKLRPGVYHLLASLSSLYDLHIYTMGDRVYAHEMASLLDSTGTLFKNKIISRNDSKIETVKDLKLLLGAEDMALVVDDTVAVWTECAENIMQVERYHYFPPSPERGTPSTPSYLHRQADENGDVGQLSVVLKVLERVHACFYSSEPPLKNPDVRSILSTMRAEVLQGCVIVFSKVIPLDQQQVDATRHPLWKMATSLGAQISMQVDEHTTHVVTLSRHTDKVKHARKAGIHAVHPSWLILCNFRWENVPEAEHPAPDDLDTNTFLRGHQIAEKAALAAAGGGLGIK